MKPKIKVLIKGAGEMATGVTWRLHQCRFQVLMTETKMPLAVRRAVSFCEVVYDHRMSVEGNQAVLIDRPDKSGLTQNRWWHR